MRISQRGLAVRWGGHRAGPEAEDEAGLEELTTRPKRMLIAMVAMRPRTIPTKAGGVTRSRFLLRSKTSEPR